MFCGSCGTPVAEGRRFCGSCGTPVRSQAGSGAPGAAATAVIAAPAPPARTAVIASPPAPLRAPWSLGKKIAAGLVLVVAAAAAGGYWWWSHRPVPPYQVQDPGLYPFQVRSADGKGSKWGFVDATGKVLIPPSWDSIDPNGRVLGRSVAFSEGLCAVLKDGKWGYIDPTGNPVIATQFESVFPFVEGMARVQLGNQTGYIDKTGRYVINPQFYQAGDFHEGLAAALNGEGGWGFINKTGTYVILPRFQAIDLDGFSAGLAAVCTQGKCGYINRSGEFVIQPQFPQAGAFFEGLAPVRMNGKTGFINTSGTIVINPQFDQTTNFSGGLAAVSVSGRQGTIDKQGKYVVNPGHYGLALSEGETLVAATSEGTGLITRGGQWILKPTRLLTGVGQIFGKVFLGSVTEDRTNLVPISTSGKILAGPYQGAMLEVLAQDLENEKSAMQSMRAIMAAQVSYSAAYPARGFAASLERLGPALAAPDENHAGLVDASLASGSKDNYQFTISIPPGTTAAGTNFNYFLIGKPAANHFGRTLCTDSTATVHFADSATECTSASPVLGD